MSIYQNNKAPVQWLRAADTKQQIARPFFDVSESGHNAFSATELNAAIRSDSWASDFALVRELEVRRH